ncbi:alkaline phosphatase family protein [Novosphingobium aquimarinum]|uniref:hypothetical protein n=1 Tax=Novosphingobium aquimarinum TaxID=2682494 RepID=UPI0012EC1613|nr:hypothetical protein [Novosphingobium aquimarinum]
MTDLPMHFESGAPRAERIIALELNELCPDLLERWMAEGRLPNFRALYEESAVHVTSADVTEPAQLEPWIQWYSIHTGLPYEEHRVFHLTDGARAGHPDIYRMLMAAGRRVASFASMNVAPFSAPGSVYLGDPWTEDGNASPAELNIYNRFVSHNVREYSNAAGGLGKAEQARFLAFMASHGLSARTVFQILAQLADEKRRDPALSWKRVALLDRLQFDVFRSTWRRHRPHYASFFANSIAHLQHSYWRHMDPNAFTVRPDAREMAIYGDAIRFGYEAMDKLVGEFRTFARREGATLVFMTALSQQPFLRHEETGGQHFHRLHDVRGFLKSVGIACSDVDPTMTHQYLASFASAAEHEAARARLAAFVLAGEGPEAGRAIFDFPAIRAAGHGLYLGCQIARKTAPDTPVHDEATGRTVPFGSLFYQIEAIKSGRHHPDGCLWIQTGAHRRFEERPSILDILPTMLELLGVPTPAGLRGSSLLPHLAAV